MLLVSSAVIRTDWIFEWRTWQHIQTYIMHQHIINQDHYSDAIMGVIASQITRHTVVYSTVHSGADQRKYQSSASLAFVQGSHRWPVNSPYKWPVTRKMFPFDDVIVTVLIRCSRCLTKMWPIWWLSYKSVLTLISRTLLFPLNSTSIYIRSIELNRFFCANDPD